MKSLYYLLSIPVVYSGFMIYKTPTLSDAIIVASQCALIGCVGYINAKFNTTKENSELSKLESELKIERMKLSIDQVREAAVHEKSLRDARHSSMGYEPGKQIKF